MDILTLASKLKPLIPEQVRIWLKAREFASVKVKSLIDQQIVESAHKYLGDFNNKFLLSLPSEKVSRGPISLGTLQYENPKWSFGLYESELIQNVSVFGRSGAGKTMATFQILSQLAQRGIPFILFDWKRNGRDLTQLVKKRINFFTPGRPISPLAFNPFIPPPHLERNVFVNQIVDIFGDAYTLGDAARSVLQKAILYSKENVTPKELLQKVKPIPDAPRLREWKISVIRALESLVFAGISNQTNLSQKDLVEKLLKNITVIELDALNENGKKFLIPALTLWLYYTQLSTTKREKLQFMIVLEEAHNVLLKSSGKGKESVMEMLLRQGRELGVGTMIIDQQPSLISSVALANTYTSICLNLKDPTDIQKTVSLSQVNDVDKRVFSALPVGQGVVKLQDRWRKPVLVKFPMLDFKKGILTDQKLKEYLKNPKVVSSNKASVSRQNSTHRNLTESSMNLLNDIVSHPYSGVFERYQRLGITSYMGNQLKIDLQAKGLVNSHSIVENRARKILLELTPKGRIELGLDGVTPLRGGYVHEYWKWEVQQFLESNNYFVIPEAKRHGGRVDLKVQKIGKELGEPIGIEIETGHSDFLLNVKNGLHSFSKLALIATSVKAFSKIRDHLNQEGFVISSRLIVLKCSTYKVQLIKFLAASISSSDSWNYLPDDTPIDFVPYSVRHKITDWEEFRHTSSHLP